MIGTTEGSTGSNASRRPGRPIGGRVSGPPCGHSRARQKESALARKHQAKAPICDGRTCIRGWRRRRTGRSWIKASAKELTLAPSSERRADWPKLNRPAEFRISQDDWCVRQQDEWTWRATACHLDSLSRGAARCRTCRRFAIEVVCLGIRFHHQSRSGFQPDRNVIGCHRRVDRHADTCRRANPRTAPRAARCRVHRAGSGREDLQDCRRGGRLGRANLRVRIVLLPVDRGGGRTRHFAPHGGGGDHRGQARVGRASARVGVAVPPGMLPPEPRADVVMATSTEAAPALPATAHNRSRH